MLLVSGRVVDRAVHADALDGSYPVSVDPWADAAPSLLLSLDFHTTVFRCSRGVEPGLIWKGEIESIQVPGVGFLGIWIEIQ